MYKGQFCAGVLASEFQKGDGKMKKTKIICTMGPNSDDREIMKALVENGMDVQII